MSTFIPLCVPFERRSEAAAGGASFDQIEKCWLCPADSLLQVLPFVPYRYRPDRKPPFIRPWMVPQALWGRNLRALLEPDDWKHIRKDCYARAGSRCRVCGRRGPQWPVEADEGWAYDDETRVQTLKGVIALCPDCHAVRHWGRTIATGKHDEALAWMEDVNGWTRAQALECGNLAMEEWHQRSRFDDWRCDFSWVERHYGVKATARGAALAIERNRDFVAQARAQFGDVNSAPKGSGYLQHLINER